MCTGVEIALIAGTLMSAGGAVQQGQAAKKAANFNAAVARNNAIAARQTAAENARRQERLGRKRTGELRAGVGAADVQMAGSALDLVEDTVMEEELQTLSIIHAGEVQASGFNNTAILEAMQGRAAAQSGYFRAGSTLLIGGAKLAKK